jgi:uncharacterized membrane protein YeaQ/YmgE (transglycosylase-associated protein family)
LEIVVGIVWLALLALAVGVLGRLAIPGPDPMPWWLTIVIGLVGTIVGGSIGYALAGGAGYFLGAVIFAALVIVVYRRVVQRRGVTGPDAQARPTRGLGLRRRT